MLTRERARSVLAISARREGAPEHVIDEMLAGELDDFVAALIAEWDQYEAAEADPSR